MKLIYLLKKELLEDRKSMFVYGLTIFIIMLVSSIVTMLFSGSYRADADATSYEGFFTSFLFLGGFIIASLVYREEMYGKTTQHSWLMLPASSVEKLASGAIFTTLIYPLALLAFITVSSLLIEGFSLILFRAAKPVLNPVSAEIWQAIPHYMVLQSVFLLGSTYFRKAAFIKTVLSLGLVGLVLGLLTIAFGRVVFNEFFSGMMLDEDLFINNFVMRYESPSQLVEFKVFETIGKIIYWAALAPFCLVVSWFRIREVQAYDAV